MTAIQTATEVLERHHLELRSKLLEAAATLDRLWRADETDAIKNDPRLEQFQQAIAVLAGSGTDRAEQIQMIFSDDYVSDWDV